MRQLHWAPAQHRKVLTVTTPIDPASFEFGLDSFGEIATDGDHVFSDAETLRLIVEEAQLAESVGLDVFSVGEHYREGFVDSATPVLLAAAAQATTAIHLGTSVTVLSTQDPVRLYQEFATVNGISDGRAQLVLGRASSIDSFPLFGYDIGEYDHLFEEKLELFVRLMREDRVTWSGRYRSALDDVRLHPRMPDGGIPAWIGIGGSPDSVVRAARYGLPLMMAIIGGRPERFAGHAELYLRALEQFGHPNCPSPSTRSASSPTPTIRHGRPTGNIGSPWSRRSARNAASTRPPRSGTRSRRTPDRCSSARTPARISNDGTAVVA